MTNLQKFTEKARANATKAHLEICGLASGKRRWTMCAPPEKKTDSDFVLQTVVDDNIRILEALEKQAAALADIASNPTAQEIEEDDGCTDMETSYEMMIDRARTCQAEVEKLLGVEE